MKHIATAFSLIFLLVGQPAFSQQALSPEQEKYLAQVNKVWQSLDKQHGKIKLPNDVAGLDVPEGFFYLTPADAEKVLVEVWGNPPGAGKNTLGMLFPSEAKPFDRDAWGVTIGYEEDGYVSDEDADKIDYHELLSQMKADTAAASKERVRKGYEPIELVGWAAEPFYDKLSHKLHWAKEVRFGDSSDHTLNYNIRVLGRKGVLVLNFIAGMNQKSMIDTRLASVLAMADFEQGSRYEDFKPGLDKVAAYGIGALVAGKVIAKTGLLAAAFLFLKKFAIVFIVAIGVFVRKLFARRGA